MSAIVLLREGEGIEGAVLALPLTGGGSLSDSALPTAPAGQELCTCVQVLNWLWAIAAAERRRRDSVECDADGVFREALDVVE